MLCFYVSSFTHSKTIIRMIKMMAQLRSSGFGPPGCWLYLFAIL